MTAGHVLEMDALPAALEAAPSHGLGLPELDALVLEVGASYPLLAYVLQPEEDYDPETALDPLILAGLVSPSI